jgi:hypothetical protein
MLNGVPVSSKNFFATDNATETAVRRVRAMKFVGLTECPGESTSLFRKRLIRPSHDAMPFLEPSLVVVRALNKSHFEKGSERLALMGRFRDSPDQTIYAAAASRFFLELSAHGVAVTSADCLKARSELERAQRSVSEGRLPSVPVR